MKNSDSAEAYILTTGKWIESLTILRELFLSTGMTETLKWGAPVYTHKGRNIASMAAFKNYVALWFYQGVLLKDDAKKLVNAQEGVTKALRQWRFTSAEEILKERTDILAYIAEAITNSEQGKEIKAERNKALQIPVELQNKLDSDYELKSAFDTFTPGRRREFAEYIAQPKTEATRISRLEKIVPMIMSGTGLNDKYKNKG